MTADHRLAATSLLFAFIALAVPPANAEWKAGSAKINITPRQLMWMSGYGGRSHPAEDKLTNLWAKALVLEDGNGERGLLLTLDLIGIDRALSQSVCRSLEEAYGFTRDQIAICNSHTHTGPVVGRNLAPLHYLVVDRQQQTQIDQYVEQLKPWIQQVVGEALANLEPCELVCGSGVATFAVNRRNNPEGDVPMTRTTGTLNGPFDHDVPVLAVRDGDGNLDAVVFGYACHSTVLSFYQWSGDYPGFAQAELETQHPGCIALFWAGCGADQNPLPRRSVELAKHYGRRLAIAVDAVLLTSQMTPVEDKLTTRYREVDLPLDRLPTREEIETQTQSTNKFTAARAQMLLARVEAGEDLPTAYPYPIGTWRIGDEVQLVVLGGEVVVDYALRLKAELGGKNTWVAGYANDVMAYIPSRRVLAEGGYEGASSMVYYGLPTIWTPVIEEAIVREVHAQLAGNE